jgi:glycosyltransferase involved in cell wall biosynthesis
VKPYLLVTGDFGRFGGMDWANHALALHLANLGHPVHLVGFTASEDLTSHPKVRFHQVPKPLGSYFLGFPLLSRVGRKWAAIVTAEKGRVIVNGGNCRWSDINWVHYLHAAYEESHSKVWPRSWDAWRATRFRAEERRALTQAKFLVTTAERNREDLVRLFGIRRETIKVIALGTDPKRFRPPTPEERAAARADLGLGATEPVLGFVGALGDRRKGFDTLYSAWRDLCPTLPAGAALIVAGAGRELPHWQERAKAEGLADRVKFLGFYREIPKLLWACDAVAAPSRYEPYSLAAQEALASGTPCFLSRSAGLSERYPKELRDLLLDDPENAEELSRRLAVWAKDPGSWRNKVRGFGEELRSFTWTKMAEQWVESMEPQAESAARRKGSAK